MVAIGDKMKGPGAGNQTEVGLRMTRRLLLNEAAGLNAVFSPLSLHVLLSMGSAAKSGAEKDQLLSFLKAKSEDDLHEFASDTVASLFVNTTATDDADAPKVTATNGIWIDKSLTFKPKFKAVIDKVYKAVAEAVDFANNHEQVVEEVNAWAEKNTNGLIKNALPPGQITSYTRVILANVLHFKAQWCNQFDRFYTRDDKFHRLGGSSIRVPFMRDSRHQFMSFMSVHRGFKVLRLGYRGGEGERRHFSMYFLLPDKRDGLPALVDRACSEAGFLDRYKPQRAVDMKELRIPKFKISLHIDAKRMLGEMGLELKRNTEMVGDHLVVAHIIQKAVIEVDEQGTEAAAFTESDDDMGCCLEQEQPKKLFEFIADHPFMFMIREEVSGIVLFTGQVLDPSQEGEMKLAEEAERSSWRSRMFGMLWPGWWWWAGNGSRTQQSEEQKVEEAQKRM